MSDSPATKLAAAAEAWRTLYLPILIGITAVLLIVHDNVIQPPGSIQGASGVGLALISLSLGLGFDITKLKGK